MKARVKIRAHAALPADALFVVAEPLPPGHTYAGRRWKVSHAGRPLFEGTTRLPFLDAARELLRRGNDPSRLLVMVGAQGQECLSARLSYAARWTVAEGERSGPRFIEWHQRPDFDRYTKA